jgi:peptide chain release factor 3
MTLSEEVRKRRTFAIISHPDAGKTTLTEKLLLYGGAIHIAGQVSARRRQRAVTSDWMELERERGISITSTVLQFPYAGHTINLLDTPGHQDFGEDTYRTLLAADSAVMLIDAAKGVEPQTKKLFAICRERGIPLFTFMNKMDRPARDPLELLDELESVLGIGAYPMNWPLGSGDTFKGVYDRSKREMNLFERSAHGATKAAVEKVDARDPKVRSLVDETTYAQFIDGLELLEGAGEAFDPQAMLRGAVTPVFFGSAVTNFGVQLFLDRFIEMSPEPAMRGDVAPAEDRFTGFVFKIQANMDPRHRDRVAFVRICSGKFERDMIVRNERTGKDVRLSRAMKLFADERESLEAAYAGDVVGLANPGVFAIGDTLYEGSPVLFDPIPPFAPEHFATIRSIDTSSYKSFGKGIAQLREEGAVQVFYPWASTRSELQFDVAKYRLESEYGVKTVLSTLPYALARRVQGDAEHVSRAQLPTNARLVEDWEGRPVALFESEWSVRLAREWNPDLAFMPFAAEVQQEVLS